MKVTEIANEPPMILIYGPAGSGKTAFAMTAGEVSQLIDLEGGAIVGAYLQDAFTDARKQVDILRYVEDSPYTATSYRKLKSRIRDIENECRNGAYPFKILILDSFTVLCENILRFIFSTENKLAKSPAERFPIPQLQHYNFLYSEVEGIFTTLRALPICKILICHENARFIRDIEVRDISAKTRTLRDVLPRYFDEVWYMNVSQEGKNVAKRELVTCSAFDIRAETRRSLQDQTPVSLGLPKVLSMIGYDVLEKKDEKKE